MPRKTKRRIAGRRPRRATTPPRLRNGASFSLFSALATPEVLLSELDDVSRPERHEEVSPRQGSLQRVDNPFLFMGIDDAPVPGPTGGVGHDLAGDSGDGLLARGIDVHDDVHVGGGERLAE